MILTKAQLHRCCEEALICLTAQQEKEILDRFGREPDDLHEWSEQDIHEQIRKMLR